MFSAGFAHESAENKSRQTAGIFVRVQLYVADVPGLRFRAVCSLKRHLHKKEKRGRGYHF